MARLVAGYFNDLGERILHTALGQKTSALIINSPLPACPLHFHGSKYLGKRVSVENRLRLRSGEESSIRPLVKRYSTLMIDLPLPA